MSSEEIDGIEIIRVRDSENNNNPSDNSTTAPLEITSEEPPTNLEVTSPKLQKTVYGGRILLNPGISPINFYASLVHVIIVQFNHTVTSTLQPLLLLNNPSFGVDHTNSGRVLGLLMFFQTATKICLTPMYGFLIDKIGRRPMVLTGALLAFLGYILVPFQTSVFPGYTITKIMVANGGNMMTLAPFVADYVHDSSKGKAMGITTALGSLGQFLGAGFISVLSVWDVNPATMHVIVGFTIITVVSTYIMGVKGGKYFLSAHKKDYDEDPRGLNHKHNKEEKFIPKMRNALTVLSKNGWLMISLAITILARADYYLITIVLALFVKSFDPKAPEATEEEIKEASQSSMRLVSSYQSMFFSLSLIGNLIYGQILDKVSTLRIIYPTCSVAIFGYLIGSFANSKTSPLLLMLVFFAGTAMPGLLNSAHYLAMKHYPKELRGTLNSLMSVIGVAGYLFLAVVGGYLFDKVGKSAPFTLFVGMLGFTMACIFVISKKGNFVASPTKVEKELIAEDQPEEMSMIYGV